MPQNRLTKFFGDNAETTKDVCPGCGKQHWPYGPEPDGNPEMAKKLREAFKLSNSTSRTDAMKALLLLKEVMEADPREDTSHEESGDDWDD